MTLVNLFLIFFGKLLAECTLSESTLSHDYNTDTCTLPSGNFVIEFGVVFAGTHDITINPPLSGEAILSGKVTVFNVTSTVTDVDVYLTITGITLRVGTNDAALAFPLIRVTNGGLILKSVTFGDPLNLANVKTALIRLKEGSLLTIDQNCYFVNIRHTNVDEGEIYGGIMNADSSVDEVKFSVKNSKFINNSLGSKGYGGAFVISTYGQQAVITIENCEFTDCTSIYYAGAFDLYSETNLPIITIENCNFTGCISGRDSGAIWLEMSSPGEINRCNFTKCSAKNDGGGIFLFDDYVVKGSNYTVYECVFRECVSVGEVNRSAQGAGIYVQSAGWTLIEGCSFVDCVTNAYHGHGGAVSSVVSNFVSFTIKLSNFTRCIVDKDDSTNPSGEEDGGDGGAVSIKMDLFNSIIIDSCRFEDCSASNHGGSLDVVGGSLSVLNSAFINSKAIAGNGGSISTTGVIVTIEGTTFTNSQLLNASAKGVEVYSAREIIHYGSGNTFACQGDNDVIYKDVSLRLIVCENKNIKDLECTASAASVLSTAPFLSLLRIFAFVAAVFALAVGLF